MTSSIKIEGKTIMGVFKHRLTRFSALVKIRSGTVQSFLPNPGRMAELLTPGADVILKEVLDGKRKTSYDLIGVHYKGEKVSLDCRVPNKLVLEALRTNDLPEFSEYDSIKPEYLYGNVRFDFLLSSGRDRCILEVKSCTLVRNGTALFPDAETKRGSRHLRQLLEAKDEGYRACVLFLVQRSDAYVFSPYDETDAEFGKFFDTQPSRGLRSTRIVLSLWKTRSCCEGELESGSKLTAIGHKTTTLITLAIEESLLKL